MPDDIELKSAHGMARLRTLGTQVTSATLGGRELLWLTPRPTVPLRGGVPICFPWFGSAEPPSRGLPSHGFGRRLPWHPLVVNADRATLALHSSAETLALWPHRFEAELTVSLGSTLDFGLAVRNIGDAPLSFTYALHTYFAVENRAGWRVRELGAPVTAAEPIDAVFETSPDRLEFDGLYVEADSMPSTVVWNPGPNHVADIGDEWQRFMCVERGRVGSAAVTLHPGAQHEASMRIGLLQ